MKGIGGFQSPEVTPKRKKGKKIKFIRSVPLGFSIYSQNIQKRLNFLVTSYLVYSQIWLNLCRDNHQFFYIFLLQMIIAILATNQNS
jgi:hypothetical protein